MRCGEEERGAVVLGSDAVHGVPGTAKSSCPYNVPKFQWDSALPRIVKCDLPGAQGRQDRLGVRRGLSARP